jgi:sulfatase modifying factor 1
VIALPGGAFTMGSDHDYPEERPAHRVTVRPFAISATPVSVAEFAAFVLATGHVTTAERDGSSAVFTPPAHPVDLADPLQWWSLVPGASWRHPDGAAAAREDHPVVQVSYADALAYCAWTGTRLPAESEWEHAAQGAHRGAANVWHGPFPHAPEGLATTSPVGSHPPNRQGLHDAVGNVWEWTATPWSRDHRPGCCAAPAADGVPLQVAKGGSFLCSEQYCARYRPAARTAMAVDSPACHLGFRTAR